MSDRHTLYRDFWSTLRNEVNAQEAVFRPQGPAPDDSNLTYLNSPLGRDGVALNFNISRERDHFFSGIRIKDDDDLYQSLLADRDAIETEIGTELEWLELGETNDRYKIGLSRPGDIVHQDQWDEYISWFISTGNDLTETFRPRL